MSFLGADLGSGSCKAAVFEAGGELAASSSAAYASRYPAPGLAECDPGDMWGAFVSSVRSVAAQCGSIEAMCVSTHGETIIPLSASGSPLMQAIMNADNRAVKQTETLESRLGKREIYSITGLLPLPMFSIGKIMWLKEFMPDIFEKTSRFASPADFLLGKLRLEPVCDYTAASRFLAFDMREGKWSGEILAAAQVSQDKLPGAVPAGTLVGKLDPEAARLLNLPARIPVYAGGHDQPCAAVGAGVTEAGRASVSAGTYEVMGVSAAAPPDMESAYKSGLNVTKHMLPGMYFSYAFFPGGHLSNWFENLFAENAGPAELESFYSALNASVERKAAGPTGVCMTPHLIGSGNPFFDNRASGIIAGITPGAGKTELYQAVYEGIACELAMLADILEEAVGRIGSAVIFGGNASADFSVQLRADLCRKQFTRLDITETVARGAAQMAAAACGASVLPSDERQFRVFEPSPRRYDSYKKQISQYRTLYPSLERFRVLQRG